MIRAELIPAFLIHRRAFKNNSLLLDFLTKAHGKICLVGKGIRSSKTNIQMFQQLNISFSGRTNLKTLTHWEVNDQPRNMTGETLILAMYVNELIARLLSEQDPHPKLFNIYQQFVNKIVAIDKQTSYWLLRLFEHNLLAELGYALDCSQDIKQHNIDTNSHYEYQHQLGFVRNPAGKISGKLIGQLLLGSVDNMPDLEQLRNCRDLNRQRLNHLLGDKPLKSRELFFSKQ